MSVCQEILPLVTLRRLGVIEDAEAARLDSHLAACATCPGAAAELEQALEVARAPKLAAPEGGWDAIEAALESRAVPAPVIPITLACTYCHSALARDAKVHCASCLAPYHAECFAAHGRCSIPGCQETRVVQARALPRSRRAWVPVLAAAFAAFGAAAAVVDSGRETPAPVARVSPLALAPLVAPAPVASAARPERRRARHEHPLLDARQRRERDELVGSVPEQLELGSDGFEWQLRSDTPPEAHCFSVNKQRLTISNPLDAPVLFGKHKRSWREFSLRFRLRFERGTRASFLGRIATAEWHGLSSALDWKDWAKRATWDEIPLCGGELCGIPQDDGPFRGIAESRNAWTAVTLEFRVIDDWWDVKVDGSPSRNVLLKRSAKNRTGGYGFLVEKGQIEIEDLYARVLTRVEDDARMDDDD